MTPILVSIALLLANALFVAAEFATIAARRTRVEAMVEGGGSRPRAALAAMRELSLTLSASQLGITAASLGLGAVAEPAVAHAFEGLLAGWIEVPDRLLHTISLAVALTIVVFLHMVIGEMVPKNIAIAEPESTALWVALPMRAFTNVFRPAIAALTAIANSVLRLMGVEPRDELATARTAGEIASMLSESQREGLIGPTEHRILVQALDFRDREVGTLMVPRHRVVSIDTSTSVAGAERVVRETGHSRIPVLGDGPDDVRGFIHAKDLLRVDPSDRLKPLPSELIRRMPVVRETAKLNNVLVRMRHTRTHFALVVDAGRRPAGIVTLEDVLEELVGPIRDEHDIGRKPAAARRQRARRRVRRRTRKG
ncbi:MAG TPA: hemolysin family protein [Actinomycetota bacterium]|nr:hemolysin family protein [Actinomycetota bacterium]